MSDLPLYDFPITPLTSIVVALQNVGNPVISRAHFENTSPVSGARNQMRMQLPRLFRDRIALAAWIGNNLNSALFKIPVCNPAQLAVTADMIAIAAANPTGLPFSTDQPFSTGCGFKFHPTLDLVSAVTKGTNTITIDTARWPNALTHGKVFGLGTSVYHVDNISYSGTVATVTSRPPFRRDYAVSEPVRLRPSMIGKAKDANTFIANIHSSGTVQNGDLTFNEFIDDRFL